MSRVCLKLVTAHLSLQSAGVSIEHLHAHSFSFMAFIILKEPRNHHKTNIHYVDEMQVVDK